jgi:hypothetical protein
MTEVFPGRYTAQTDLPLVLFRVGMRFNKLWAVHKWGPVFLAMPRMLDELRRNPESGLLSARTYISGRIILVEQYWDSFEKLVAYAQDRDRAHFPAWVAFNRAVGDDGSVGVWHESYIVEPGKVESLYGNMPRFGLAAVTNHVPATGRLSTAAERMHRR